VESSNLRAALQPPSSPLHQPDQHQQDHRTQGGMNDRRKQTTARAEADAGQDQAGDEGPDDPHDDVAEGPEAVAFDDPSGKPSGDGADDQHDKQAFDSHIPFLLNADF